MKFIKHLLILSVLCAMVIPAQGQILERMTKRATRKVENEINKKADRTVDDAFDKIFNKKKDTRGKPKDKGDKYEYEDEYEDEKSSKNVSLSPNEFLGSVQYEMTTSADGKTTNSDISYTFDTDRTSFVVEGMAEETTMKVIFHHSEGKMTTISKTSESQAGFKTKIRSVTAGHDPMESTADIEVVETDETRIILGYNCKKYKFSSFDGIDGECWVSDDAELMKANDALLNMANVLGGGNAGGQNPAIAEKGFVLESAGIDKDGNPFTMKASNILVGMINPKAFSTDGVTITDLSDMMPGN